MRDIALVRVRVASRKSTQSTEQLSFQAAVEEQLVDGQKLAAQFQVTDVALDGGQDLRQGQFKRDNDGVRHGN